jgi:hypothetical protein
VQPLGSATEVELLGDRDEVLDEAKIEPFDRQSLMIGAKLVLDLALALAHPFSRSRGGRETALPEAGTGHVKLRR